VTDHKTPSTPAERRDLMTVLARGVAADLGEADPAFFTDPSTPAHPDASHEERVGLQAARVLGELLYVSSLLALGLRDPADRNHMNYLHAGLDRLTHSPTLRHQSECPGHPDTPDPGGEKEPQA
jgi:hypothetical protein